MSPDAFDNFMDDEVPRSVVSYSYSSMGASSSATYSKSTSTKFVTPDGQKLFPDIPAFMPTQGKATGDANLQSFLEKMRSQHETGKPSTSLEHETAPESAGHIMLEPEEND